MKISTRIALVTGKGGTGKTTVATLIARSLKERGARVLFVSLAHPLDQLHFTREMIGEASMLYVDGESALAEYLSRRIPSRTLLRRLVTHDLYRRFVAAAPGLKELMALGKICDEERRLEDGRGWAGFARPRWDTIVVDAPATGHALEFLGMPQSVLEGSGPGLLSAEVTRMLRGLRDPRRAQIFPVTLPEEMPLAECAELTDALHRLGFSIGAVFLNRVRRSPIDPPSLLVHPPLGERASSAVACARIDAAWSAAERERIARMRERSREVIVELPALEEGALSELSAPFERALEVAA